MTNRVENFKSILDFNSLIWSEYLSQTSWFNLNIQVKNSDLNRVLTSRELDSTSIIQLDAISLVAQMLNSLLSSTLLKKIETSSFNNHWDCFLKDLNADWSRRARQETLIHVKWSLNISLCSVCIFCFVLLTCYCKYSEEFVMQSVSSFVWKLLSAHFWLIVLDSMST